MTVLDDTEDPVLLLAESTVALAEAQRGQNDAVTQQLREVVRALLEAPPPVIPPPDIHVAAAQVTVTVPEAPPAPVTVNVPDVQTVVIASIPRARIRVIRGPDGRITELEVM